MIHTVLHVKTLSGVEGVFIAAVIAMVPAIRNMDALNIVKWAIIDIQ